MDYYGRNYPPMRMSRGYGVRSPSYDEYNYRYNSRPYRELPPYGYGYGGKRKTRKHRKQAKKSRKHSRRRKN